jgi:hypothetical protein
LSEALLVQGYRPHFTDGGGIDWRLPKSDEAEP